MGPPRQGSALRWLRPVGLVAAVLIVSRAFRANPPPGWHGAGLGILIALCATTIGAVGLTRREAEVLSLIGEGLSNSEIAARLMVSQTTVKSHLNHLLTKTGDPDRAVRYAFRPGLTSPDSGLPA